MFFGDRWCFDFEFYCPEGERPLPLCLVAYEINSGRWIRLSRSEFPRKPPYPIGASSTLIAFAADAELACHLALGWDLPERIIDLHVEYLNYTNYLERSGKFEDSNLLAVCAALQIDCISEAAKQRGRSIAMFGGPKTNEEAAELLDYCQQDVLPLVQIYRKLIGPGNICQALERGRFMKAVARMERYGIPLDVEKLNEFRAKWDPLKWRLVNEVDEAYHVYDGISFSHDKFEDYVRRRGLSWPRTPTGLLKTDRETFKEKINLYPELAPLHELKSTLSLMRKESITVGSDGRNRTSLHAFRSKTSRNQPAASKFILSAPSWARSFIKPAEGYKILYIDYAQQEFLIAGSLSKDRNMVRAYAYGDPYINFARMAGAVPFGATKKSHPKIRELFKTAALGVQYSMQSRGLAARIGKSVREAEILLGHHRTQFPNFWHWVERICAHMEFNKVLFTDSGWRIIRKHKQFAPRWRRSIQNWPIQSAGADLLRLVCCLCTEAGIRVVAPVHDALVIEDSADRIEKTVGEVREIMHQASVDLFQFPIRTDAEIFPDRFIDPRGVQMWNRIIQMMAEEPYPRSPQIELFEGVRTGL